MMKKHLLYLFFFALALSSCKKDTTEPILGNVDERLSETLTAYQSQLAGAQFGWKGYLLTDSKVTATFLFSFTDKNRTTMSADYATTPSESSYRLKALQRPTLLFDTYSTLHLIADPTPSKFGGDTGGGYYSDFEFAFLSASADTIKLEGTFNKSKLVLVRSKSAADNASAFTAPDDIAVTLSKLLTYFKRSTIGGIECELRLDPANRVIGFNYLDGGTLKTTSSNYFVSGTKIVLYDPIVIGTTTVTALEDVSFDAGAKVINTKISGGSSIQIKEAISPLKYDISGAANWRAWATASTYVSSELGFHINGVDDGLGLKSLAGYRRIDYQPNLGIPYDGARIIATASYGPAIIPTITADGLVIFPNSGFQFGTVPTAATTVYLKYLTQLFQAQGYYLIQTNGGTTQSITYDMVNVADAKAWVSWHY
jgi:hypothetical protein